VTNENSATGWAPSVSDLIIKRARAIDLAPDHICNPGGTRDGLVRANPGRGGIWVRIDSLKQPELWAQFLIPIDTLNALL
jgi:hypothetical protein